eukprot:6056338-Prymnesium_polylepis.1
MAGNPQGSGVPPAAQAATAAAQVSLTHASRNIIPVSKGACGLRTLRHPSVTRLHSRATREPRSGHFSSTHALHARPPLTPSTHALHSRGPPLTCHTLAYPSQGKLALVASM